MSEESDIFGELSGDGAERWNAVSEHVSENARRRFSAGVKMLPEKLDGALIVNQEMPFGVVVPGNQISAVIGNDMIAALSEHDTFNEAYADLFLKIIAGIPYGMSPDEKHMAFLDVKMFGEMLVLNNALIAHGADSAASLDGLEYFWDLLAVPDESGWVSSARFCAFVGQIVHASKSGLGSERGFIETFNILALRHRRGEENFVDLNVAQMLNSVEW